MGMKKIKKAIAKELEKVQAQGWSQGYDSAMEMCQEIKNNSYVEGAQDEQNRVQEVIRMNIQWATEAGRGPEIVFWNRAKEMLTPIKIDYSEEAYKRSLEEDGF